MKGKKFKKMDRGNFSQEFLDATRVVCKCGHVVNFISKRSYIECTHCHNLIFKDSKAEYDYKVKRRLGVYE